jgi:hypothetical protein
LAANRWRARMVFAVKEGRMPSAGARDPDHRRAERRRILAL